MRIGIETRDVLELTFVGNPIMHHLLLGISPIELGGAPFTLATDESVTLWATELDLRVHPNARIYMLPCIAGHVGADTAGMILAEAPHLSDEMTLLVDVGTNAEIVLGNRACPFAEKVVGRPALCMMTSNVFGGIAAENLGYAKVVIEKAIARGDEGCRVVVHLKPTPQAEAATGREYFKG